MRLPEAERAALVLGEALFEQVSANLLGSQTADATTWSLYRGYAGTLLFLLELGRVFPGSRLLPRLRALPLHELGSFLGSAGPSLHSGAAGGALVLARAGTVLSRPDLSEAARDLVLAAAGQRSPSSDWAEGLAGTLFALAFVERRSGCPRLKVRLEELLRELMSRARPWPQGGVVFDVKAHEVHPVCGFAHGTSGIAYALLVAGVSHPSAPEVIELVQEAADYDSCQRARHGQWPDHRRPIYEPKTLAQLETAYLAGDVAPFMGAFPPSDSWCNGSVGIGLLRCALLERGIRDAAASELALALCSSRRWARLRHAARLEDFTLCHGLGGSCELFFEAARVTGREGFRRMGLHLLAPALDRASVAETSRWVRDLGPGLMTGAAGLAWTLLRAAHPAANSPLLLKVSPVNAAPQSSRISMRRPPRHAPRSPAFPRLVRSHALLAVHRRLQGRAARAAAALSDSELLGTTLFPDPSERWSGDRVVRWSDLSEPASALTRELRRTELLAALCEGFCHGRPVGDVIASLATNIEGPVQDATSRLLQLVRWLLRAGHLNALITPVTLFEEPTPSEETIMIRSSRVTDAQDTIDDLANRISDRWRKAGWDERSLPEIAADVLCEVRLHERVGGLDLLERAVRFPLPVQADPRGDFGEPPITLYHDGRLVIDVYPWFSSSTTIHQHGFSGAFGVLGGGSVHTRYSFEETSRVASRMRVGHLRFLDSEHLQVGDVRPISAGNTTIHGLFHLEHPSFSVVVRCVTDPEQQPQFQYFRGGLAVDPFHDPIELRRPLQALGAILRVDPECYVERACEFVDVRPPFDVFQLLLRHQVRLGEHPAAKDRIHQHVRSRLPTLAEKMLAALDDRQRTHSFNKLRSQVTDPDHRFLLALLLNVPSKRHVLSLVQKSYPQDSPGSMIVRWVGALSASAPLGVRFTETQLDVLRAFLESVDPGAASGTQGTEHEVLEHLGRTYDIPELESQLPLIRNFRETLRDKTLLSTLVEGS